MNNNKTNELNLTEYELDKDIPDNIWNNYLKKYKGKYRLFLGKERTWKIKNRGMPVPLQRQT